MFFEKFPKIGKDEFGTSKVQLHSLYIAFLYFKYLKRYSHKKTYSKFCTIPNSNRLSDFPLSIILYFSMAWKVGNNGKVLLLKLEVQLYPYILLFSKLSKIEGKEKMVLKSSTSKFNFKQNTSSDPK